MKLPSLENPRTQNLIFISSLILLIIMGGWWLLLIYRFGKEQQNNIPQIVIWEGITFLILLSGTFYMWIRVLKKNQNQTHALKVFYAGLGHELKTPLTGIRFQVEILQEKLPPDASPFVKKTMTRLSQDVTRIENELDNLLELSKMYQQVHYPLQEINLAIFLKRILSESSHTLFSVKVYPEPFSENAIILASAGKLKIIFRNILSNALNHSGKSPSELKIKITLKENFQEGYHLLSIQDNGNGFSGDKQKLASLFYHYGKSEGHGLGLYLVQELTRSMGGKVNFVPTPNFTVNLILKASSSGTYSPS